MKIFTIIVLLLGTYGMSYGQDKVVEPIDTRAMNTEDLPAVVIRNAGENFSVYIPDNNLDPNVKKIQNKFIAYNLGKDYDGFEEYLVMFKDKDGILTATYDSSGKLVSVVEKYDNTRLPTSVIYSIYKSYPGWSIVNDKFLYTQENGDVTKKEYNVKLKKDNEILKIKLNTKGELLSKNKEGIAKM